MHSMGALDYAGGTVVHINAAVAAFVAARVLGPRRDYGAKALLPHNVPYTLLGAGLLWFGWFGFNAGSALAADSGAALAFANTLLAPAAAIVVWLLLDLWTTGHTTAIGLATGVVVGLVAITPAAGFVGPGAAMVLGALAAIPSYYAVMWRARTSLDDSLDVVAAHGLGGLTGALMAGVLATAAWGGVDGLLAGNADQLRIQAVAALGAMAYSGVISFALLKGIALFTPLRASEGDEARGLDVPMHGEEASSSGEGAILIRPTTREPLPGIAVQKEVTA